MDEPLNVQRHAGVTTITMDDGKANVMSVRMLQSLPWAWPRRRA